MSFELFPAKDEEQHRQLWTTIRELESLGPDRCRLTAGSWSWTGLAAAIARYDVDFDVLGPKPLQEACAALAERCARAVRTPSTPE